MRVTVDDTSPQNGYYGKDGKPGSWLMISDHGVLQEPYIDQYLHHTFHSSSNDGDYMSFTFNGTAVSIYGAKRPNHGSYAVSIDGKEMGGTQSGSTSDDRFRQPLFSAEKLDPHSTHTVVLTNLASSTTPAPTPDKPYYLDIDYIEVTTTDPDDAWVLTYDDTSPDFHYTLFFAPTGNAGYYNHTSRWTTNPNASLSFAFQGSAIQLVGGLDFNHGNYTVSLDGAPPLMFNGTADVGYPNSSLYLASGLSDAFHFVRVDNHATTPNNTVVDLDYALVFTTESPSADLPGVTASMNPSSDSGGTPVGAIVGGVVGGVVALALVGAMVWYFVFKRPKTQSKLSTDPPPSLIDLNSRSDTPKHNEGIVMTGAEVEPYLALAPRRISTGFSCQATTSDDDDLSPHRRMAQAERASPTWTAVPTSDPAGLSTSSYDMVSRGMFEGVRSPSTPVKSEVGAFSTTPVERLHQAEQSHEAEPSPPAYRQDPPSEHTTRLFP